MKILKNSKYYEIINGAKAYENDYKALEKTYIKEKKDLEIKIDKIHQKLYSIMQSKKSNKGKDIIYKKIESIIRFIEKGVDE